MRMAACSFVLLSPASAELIEVRTATGRTIQVIGTSQPVLGYPMRIDSSGRYLIFPLRVGHVRVVNPDAPYLLAHLARLDLRTGQLVPLQIPVMAQINGAFDAAW
ncbi:MAG TPA: hypothetical protein VMV17_19355 [Streptosporangiaceae bacterium]|nr:hypothetical protein [Streptosporangiaceae bacterium]